MGKLDFFKQLDSMTEIIVLNNGMKVYRIKFPNTAMRLVNIQVNFGSRDFMLKSANETHFLPRGTAHFLEHLMFWQNDHNIYEDFFNRNAVLNAFTTYTDTNFMCTLLPEHILENMKELFSILVHHQLDHSMIEQEKRVIKNEIETAQMDQRLDKHYRMLRLLCNGSPISVYPTGNQDDLDSLTIQELEIAYKTFYQPQHMKLFIIGGKEDLCSILPSTMENYCNDEEFGDLKRYWPPHSHILTKDIFVSLDGHSVTPEFMVGIQLSLSVDEDLLKQKIYCEIFSRALFHMGAPLIQYLQQSEHLFLQHLSVYGHFTEDISFLILTLQGEGSKIFFDKWITYVMDHKQWITDWLAYGKEAVINAMIYESDYIRKLFDWISDYAYYDYSLLDVYKVIEDMQASDFIRLIDFFIEAKKVYISYT